MGCGLEPSFALSFETCVSSDLQEGLANVCLVGGATTLVRARIEANLPRKRGAAAVGYDKARAPRTCRVHSTHSMHVGGAQHAQHAVAVGGHAVPCRGGACLAPQAWTRFLEHVFSAVVRFVDFAVVKCLVIAGGSVTGCS
jgi:protein pelota